VHAGIHVSHQPKKCPRLNIIKLLGAYLGTYLC